MMKRRAWKWLGTATRCLGAAAVAGTALLGLALAVAYGFRYEDGMGPVRAAAIPLVWWLLAMLVLLLAAVPLTRRAMDSDSWREALSWTAASFRQGAKKGLVLALALAALGLLAAALLA